MAPLLSWFLEDITIIQESPYLEIYIKIGGLEKNKLQTQKQNWIHK